MDSFNVVCCVYCYMGCEDSFAQKVKDVLVIVPSKVRREKHHGKWVDNTVKLIPGYAFIYADNVQDVVNAVKGFKVRLLSYSDNSYVLRGSDLEFAQWVFRNSGVIGVLGAVHEKDKVRIVSGVFKDSEGSVVQLDRRNKLAKVALNIGFNVWLSYDWLDNEKTDDNNRESG